MASALRLSASSQRRNSQALSKAASGTPCKGDRTPFVSFLPCVSIGQKFSVASENGERQKKKKRKSVQMDSMYSSAPNQWPQNITSPQHVHVEASLPCTDDWKDHTTASSSAAAAVGLSGASQPALDLSDFGLGAGKHFSKRPSTGCATPMRFLSPTLIPMIVHDRSVDVNLAATILLSVVLSKLLRAVCSRSLQCDALCSDVLVYPTKSIASFHLFDAEWCNLRFPADIAVVHLSPVTTPHLSSTADDDRVSDLHSICAQITDLRNSPILTTLSNTESAQQYTQPINHATDTQSNQSRQAQSHQSSQQQTQYSYQQPTLSINPAYVQFYQHPQSSQVQTTLSPHVLHSPSAPQATTPFFSSPTGSSSAPNSEAQRRKLATDIRPLMQPNSFTGAGAVNSLVGHLDDFGPHNVDATLRLEILTKIRDNAGNHYFRAWLENVAAMDITRDWLKAGLTAKSDNLLVETIMPLLHVSSIARQTLLYPNICVSDRGQITHDCRCAESFETGENCCQVGEGTPSSR